MGEEKLDAAMTSFLLEDALSSSAAAVPTRGNEFVRYILESKNFHHVGDDEQNGIVGSSKATITPHILNAGGDPSLGEAQIGEPDVIFHSQSLEYLEKSGPSLMKDRNDTEKNCSILLNIADNLEVLTPPDDPLPWDILNMSLWKDSLWELVKEMKTVEEKCPSLIRNSGVYVLTTSPYGAFLRALTVEIDDAAKRIIIPDNSLIS